MKSIVPLKKRAHSQKAMNLQHLVLLGKPKPHQSLSFHPSLTQHHFLHVDFISFISLYDFALQHLFKKTCVSRILKFGITKVQSLKPFQHMEPKRQNKIMERTSAEENCKRRSQTSLPRQEKGVFFLKHGVNSNTLRKEDCDGRQPLNF